MSQTKNTMVDFAEAEIVDLENRLKAALAEIDALKDDASFKASKDRENEVVSANIMRACMQTRDEAIAKLDGALTRIALLERALNAMLTHMGMDEDEWNKPTFEQARSALGERT
jgi:hypothetical protein